jgi:hypothetical protein
MAEFFSIQKFDLQSPIEAVYRTARIGNIFSSYRQKGTHVTNRMILNPKQSSQLLLAVSVLLAAGLSLISCGKTKRAALPTKIVTEVAVEKKELTDVLDASAEAKEAQRVTLTLSKPAILGRTFLYGSDLQYSSISDGQYSLVLQSLAIGHVTVQFRILGDKLQLVEDRSATVESDVNHPERLIQEFSIAKQDANEVTVLVERASPTLVTVAADASAAKERTSWIRSLEYVENGNYILIESSIELPNGQIAQFMESIFPRDTLVPENYKPLLNDAGHEPKAGRFRFLSSSPVFLNFPEEGRVKTSAANRYNIKEGDVIDWYVTPNVPEEFMTTIQAGIEGWNRYSQAMWKKDFVKFQGRMPAGMKLGDPRYNIINWDSVALAGAAYESQAADPASGIQSHSLIYLPLAWVNIGKQYWISGQYTDTVEKSIDGITVAIGRRSFLGEKLPVHCIDAATQQLSLKGRTSPDEFAKELLKNVLFHEMGHALGLDHNFKGSLSYDSENSTSAFSTSIMDYNQYNIERGAFYSIASDKGPLLEYDRQIISTLYNNGSDIKVSDPVVPACNDAESDSLNGGIDPLCIRYDAGNDPTVQGLRTLAMVTDIQTSSSGQVNLPIAIARTVDDLGDATTVTSSEELTSRVSKLGISWKGLLNFYLSSGAQSVRYMTQSNIRSLYVFNDSILPDTITEENLRNHALLGIETVLAMDTLPKATSESMTAAAAVARQWMLTTPFIKALPDAEQTRILDERVKTLSQISVAAESTTGTLAVMRGRVLGNLKRVATSPFFLGELRGTQNDLEKIVVGLLHRALTSKAADGSPRGVTEHTAAATALVTFADTAVGRTAIEEAKIALAKEEAEAKDAVAREEARTVLALLP